ncbi:type II toxin-antitoxin system HicB family antitoxin [Paenibacillus sp. PL91]|uniref:type II toxin-antitoxin system HicB family antitoxin n=1 Tax=Paenibacillus sp. PL91 TaxID=2729538 RepID=UPI00145F2791|nr:type II toxin-antitoxin system HicB family antitoxin [Paenibacillus sp. PL91]MBC9203724.1 type II toxin-antitoxin system HicB family antitoxin [Paenibacillus sp. PL91]
MKNQFIVLIEADYASNNYCAYVPALRLSAVGDTEEETLALATELITMEIIKNPSKSTFSSKVVSVEVDIEPALVKKMIVFKQ